KLKSNTTKREYKKMVEKAKEHIKAGDIFQIVLSQKFSIENDLPPFKIYRALRSVNPSPYSFYLNFPEIRIIGSSPEVLVRVRGQRVMTRPLAGTRRRGKDRKEDQELKMELLNDEKEKAEHAMLLDLGRNDLSRIAAPGSVEVTELMEVEFYSKVMHIVSQVEADLKQDLDSLDVLKAVFPAGTVSGAPKIKAVELIDGLEKEARGVYAGTVAYLSFNGNLDSCITIRTFSLVDGRLNLQVGAGIVADSDPIKEYQETLNKGRALFDALEVVREDGIRDFSN
ncbi:MAG: anthranilate synthase component I family protein, partial [Bacillota bacterium]